jgi:hypothetical protein
MKQMPIWIFFGGVSLGSQACWLPQVLAHRPTPFVLLLGLMLPSLLSLFTESIHIVKLYSN